MGKVGYLLRQDLLVAINEYTLTELTEGRNQYANIPEQQGKDYLWLRTARAATDMARLYISTWFNEDIELAPYYEYDVADAYVVNQRVCTPIIAEYVEADGATTGRYYESGGTVYVCTQDAPAATPISDTNFFTAFLAVPEEQETYVGQRALFTCIVDAPAGTPLTDSEFFSFSDSRNQTILYAVSLLTAYMLHVKGNARTVPEQQIINHKTAMDMLKAIQKGTLNVKSNSVPVDEPTDSVAQKVVFGTFDDIQNY